MIDGWMEGWMNIRMIVELVLCSLCSAWACDCCTDHSILPSFSCCAHTIPHLGNYVYTVRVDKQLQVPKNAKPVGIKALREKMP